MITSFANPKVKFLRKLEQKKYRQETGVFLIEGLRVVGEAVQIKAPIQYLVIAPDLLTSQFGNDIIRQASEQKKDVVEVSAEIFQKLAHKDGPQGIAAVVQQAWVALEQVIVKPDDLWVVLDEIADPGNLGTILRTADAVGVSGIILTGHTTDPYDPTAVKASMGAVFTLHLVQSTWDQVYQWREQNHVNLVGTSDSAEKDYQSVKYTRPIALLMGSERHGLGTEVQAACDLMVRIPMAGRSDSLNLAVATGVMLYEIFNQFRNLDKIDS
jgi:RNA methyltransferase, TrmH family